MKQKSPALGILLLVIGLLITLTGCGPTPPQNPTSTPTPTPTSDGYVICPEVTINDTANYQVESAYIGMVWSTLTYTYGLVKIRYLGSTARSFISVTASFKDQNNNQLFTDDSYVRNMIPCQIPSIPCNTTTFFTSTYDYGYYYIAEDLHEYGITLHDIAKINLTLSSSSYTYTAARGHLSTSGAPYRVEPDSWYVNVINDGTQVIDSGLTLFIFNDSIDRQYLWFIPSLYVNGVWNTTFGVGQSGYFFTSLHRSPDYLSTPVGFGGIALEWLSNSSSIIQSIMKDRSISDDKKNQLIKQQIDEETRQQLAKYRNR